MYSKWEITVIMACTVEEDGDVIMDLEQMDEQETPGFSLHAISGDQCTQDEEGIRLNELISLVCIGALT